MIGARRTAWRMITLSVSSCAVMGTLLALFSPLIPTFTTPNLPSGSSLPA